MNYAVEKDYVDFAVVKNELKTQRQPTPRYKRGAGDTPPALTKF
jgi:hypothetical protein